MNTAIGEVVINQAMSTYYLKITKYEIGRYLRMPSYGTMVLFILTKILPQYTRSRIKKVRERKCTRTYGWLPLGI